MLCFMWRSPVRGMLLLPTGSKPSLDDIAKLLACTTAELEAACDELEHYGVLSRSEDGSFVCRRMHRYYLLEHTRSERAKHAADVLWQSKKAARSMPEHAPSSPTPTPTPTPTPISTSVEGVDSTGTVDPSRPSSVKKTRIRTTKRGEINYPADFLAFYEKYPLHFNKREAYKAWEQVNAAEHLDDIIAALDWQPKLPGWLEDNGKFIPHPANWLKDHRWQDEKVVSQEELARIQAAKTRERTRRRERLREEHLPEYNQYSDEVFDPQNGMDAFKAGEYALDKLEELYPLDGSSAEDRGQ